jgi:predicted metal-binding membrane protein
MAVVAKTERLEIHTMASDRGADRTSDRTSDRVFDRAPGRASERAFFGVSAHIFAASAAVTIVWCGSMSEMGGMPMPGGWTMSMTWMRMPGQTWPGAAASFLGMWIVMMVAMMLPSLVPMLLRYREAAVRADRADYADKAAKADRTDIGDNADDTRPGRLGLLTALVGVAYFSIWALIGMVVYPLGITLAEIEMQQPAVSRAVPFAAGATIVIAGLLLFTGWKARYLERCREIRGRGRTLPAGAATAWRHGLRLGRHCSYSCAGPMAILLVLGVMDLRAMAVVTAAITLERLAPAGERVARAIGVVIVAAGLLVMIQNLTDLI